MVYVSFGQFKLVQNSETPFDREDISLYLGLRPESQEVFSAEKTLHLQISAVKWLVNPAGNKADYFSKLVALFDTVRVGDFTERQYCKGIPHSSSITCPDSSNPTEERSEDFHWSDCLGENPFIARHPHFSDFTRLRIGSPFGYFSMVNSDSYPPQPWDVTRDYLQVTSHLDLSQLLTPLILETGRVQIPNGLRPVDAQSTISERTLHNTFKILRPTVQSVLANRVYNFSPIYQHSQ